MPHSTPNQKRPLNLTYKKALADTEIVMNAVAGLEDQRLNSITRIKMTSIASRKKSINAIAKGFGSLLINVVVSEKYNVAKFLAYQTEELSFGQKVISVGLFALDGRIASDRPRHLEYLGTLCVISQHAISRVIQRHAAHSPIAVLNILQPATRWTAAANYIGHKGSFVTPVKEGLVCCGMDITENDVYCTSDVSHAPNIRTFIGHNQMRADSQERWKRMVAAGALENAPRPGMTNPVTPEQIKIFEVMAEEGRCFDQKRDEAIARQRLQAERDRAWKAHYQTMTQSEDTSSALQMA